jgi:hypothetical protein
MPEPSISLGDMVAHDLPLEWPEAVAVVQEVCTRLVSPRTGSPDLSHILLDSSGTMELLSAPPSTEPQVQRLGHLLSSLLEGTSPPAELRLFASQMTSSVTATSLDDFSRRLAYFERPGRSRLLQQLFERAEPALAAARQQREHPVAAAATADADRASGKERQRPRVDQRRLWRAIAAAVVIGLVGTGTFVGWRRLPRSSAAPAVVRRTRAAVGSLVADTMNSGRALLAKAGLLTDAPAPAKQEQVRSAVKPNSRRKPMAKPSTPEGTAVDSNPPAIPVPAAETPAVTANPVASASIVAADDLPADAIVYSADDAGVLPPTLLFPQLPRTENGTPSHSAAADAEVLVNERGVVEAVKLLNHPEQVHERMLLSAMKAWRYHPALKDGRPVRYVVRIKLPL